MWYRCKLLIQLIFLTFLINIECNENIVTKTYVGDGITASFNEVTKDSVLILSYVDVANGDLRQLGYEVNANGIKNHEKTFNFNNHNGFFVIEVGNEVTLDLQLKGDTNCNMILFVGNTNTAPTACTSSDAYCKIGNQITLSKCQYNLKWRLNNPGMFDIKLNLLHVTNGGFINATIKTNIVTGQKVATTTSLANIEAKNEVAKLTGELSVDYSPLPRPSCSTLYQVLTNMTITSKNHSEGSNYTLYVNNNVVKESRENTVSFVFNVKGKFTVKLIADSLTHQLTWTLEITVGEYFRIDFIPRIDDLSFAIPTLTEILFFAKPTDKCAVSSYTNYTWAIGNQGERKYYQANLTYIHPAVGVNSNSVKVVLEKLDYSAIYISAYDIISDLSLRLNRYLCISKPLMLNDIRFTQKGSAVTHKYSILPSIVFNKIPDDGIVFNSYDIGPIDLKFIASNVISTKNITRTVHLENKTRIALRTVVHVKLNTKTDIRPLWFVTCQTYYYRWTIKSQVFDWIKASDKDNPIHRDYIATIEEAFPVKIDIYWNNNATFITENTLYYAEKEINVDSVLPRTVQINQSFTITPTVTSMSPYFEYNWNSNGYLISSDINVLKLIKMYTKEGLYNENLKVRNNVSSVERNFQIKAQNSIVISSILYRKAVENTKEFNVTIQFAKGSMFGFQIHITDDGVLDRRSNVTEDTFIFTHTYQKAKVYTLMFNVSNSFQSIQRVITIESADPVKTVHATIAASKIKEGEEIGAIVTGFTGNQPVFNWYIKDYSNNNITFINTNIMMENRAVNIGGYYAVVLIASGVINNQTYYFNFTVATSGIHIKLNTEVNNQNFVNEKNITIEINDTLKFNADVFSTQTTSYSWFIDNTKQKSQSKEFIFRSEIPGIFNIKVEVTDGFVTNSSETLVAVATVIKSGSVEFLFSNNVITNNTNIYLNSTQNLTVNSINIDPLYKENIQLHIICNLDISERAVQEIINLVEFKPIKIPLIISNQNIHCSFKLKNQLNQVNFIYLFNIKSVIPKLEFINSPNSVSIQKVTTFTVKLSSNNFFGSLTWYLNDNEIAKCQTAINSDTDSDSCVYTFERADTYVFKVVYKTIFFTVQESHSVEAIEIIKEISLEPKSILAGTFVNITARTNVKNNLVYKWDGFTSTLNYITLNLNSGQKSITVTISNSLGELSHTEVIRVYPMLKKNEHISIIYPSSYQNVKVGTAVIVASSIISSMISYDWKTSSTSDFTESILDIGQYNLTVKESGLFVVSLNVSTPLSKATYFININAFTEVTNASITPLHLIVEDKLVEITVTSNGNGIKEYEWTGVVRHNKNVALFNTSTPGDFSVSVIVKNPIGSYKKNVQIKVYDVNNHDILTTYKVEDIENKKTIFIPPNSRVTFSISNIDTNTQYNWTVIPTTSVKTSVEPNKYHVDFIGNKVEKYLIKLTSITPVFTYDKELHVILIKAIDKATLEPKSRNLLANTSYSMNISFPLGTGKVTLNSFQLTNVVRSNYSLYQSYMEVDFLTKLESSEMTLTAVLCNKIDCKRNSWKLSSKPEVKQIQAFPSEKFVSSNSSVKFSVKDVVEETAYTWYIIIKNATECPFAVGDVVIENNDIACPIGKGEEFEFSSMDSFLVGNYTIKLVAEGPFLAGGKIESTFVITIYYEACQEPTVSLGGGEFREHMKSKWFYSEVNFTSKCSVTAQWKFEIAVDNTTDCSKDDLLSYSPELLPGLVLSTNTPVLEVPPRAFAIGQYCIKNEIKFGENGIISISFFLTVFGTPLVPIILGGSFRVIGNQQEIMLDASQTIDPDVPYPNLPKLIFKWEVKEKNCFRNLQNSNVDIYSVDNEKIDVKQNCLQPFQDHEFELKVKRKDAVNDKPQSIIQKVYVINGTVPLSEIECLTCKAYKTSKYVRSSEIKLVASCTNCGRLEPNFEWQVTGETDNIGVLLNEETVKSPLGSNILILTENVLDGIQSYKVSVNTSVVGMDGKGTSSFILQRNLSPENGSCNVSPTSGLYKITPFEIKCSGWKDIDNLNQPFIYKVLANGSMFYRGIKGANKIDFPVGDEEKDYFVDVEIQVEDSLGAFTVAYKRSIQVQPNPEAKKDPVLFLQENMLPSLEQYVNSHDLNLVTSSVIASAKLLAGGGNNESGSVLNTLMESVSLMDASSVETIGQMVDAMRAVVLKSKVKDIKVNTRDVSSNTVAKMLSLATSFSKEGIALEKSIFDGMIQVLSSQLEFHHTPDNSAESSRKRRSVGDLTSADYRSVKKIYDLILTSTVPGEKKKILKSSAVSALLRRDKGKNTMGAVNVGHCSIFAELSKIENAEDISQVLECSSVDPYSPIGSNHTSYVVSYAYRDDTLHAMSFNNLPSQEQITINVPSGAESSLQKNNIDIGNETWLIEKNQLLVLMIQNFTSDEFNLTTVGLHTLFTLLTDSLEGDGMTIHYSINKKITLDNDESKYFTFDKDTNETLRTVFIEGSKYDLTSTYYIGIEHNYDQAVNISIQTFISSCIYWNTTVSAWKNNGCRPTNQTTLKETICRCDHLTAFSSHFEIKPNPIKFEVLLKLDISSNPIAFSTCIVIVFLYLIVLFLAYRKDKKEKAEEHLVPFIGSDDGFYQYELRFKTGLYPWAGTSAKVGIQIFGTSCTTKARVITAESCFQRNALDIVRISLDRSIGKVHKIKVWHDNGGNNPSWYIERIVIRSLVNGEKFFFFCNRWLGTDSDDGKVEEDFHVADTAELKKISTIFFDCIGRGFNDYHLWLSVFERPKYSKFTRVQRVTCLFTFILCWMCINAMWFQVAPEGKTDIYIGFKGYSFEEVVIGIISVLMVFPLNIFLVFIFRKSREKQLPPHKIKIWPNTRNVYMDFVDLAVEPLIHSDETESSSDISLYNDDFSKVKRKGKVMNIHELLKEDEDEEEFTLELSQSFGDNLVLHTANNASSSTQSSTTLMLPHSIDSYLKDVSKKDLSSSTKSTNSLTLSPTHQYRTSSFSLPRNSTSELVRETLKRTKSAESDNIVSATDEARLMKQRLSPDQIRSHLTDIVEHQLSTLFTSNDNQPTYNRIPSTMTNQMHRQPKISMSIKRNELLAQHLQIPEIVELDPCTRWTLPYWCTYIAYVLCFLISALCIVVIITYGAQFGNDTSLKWLRALFVGLIEDFFLTYPIVLVIVSGIMALFIKPFDLDQVDHHDFITCQSGASIDCGTGDDIHPPSGYALELAQREGVKRKELRNYAKYIIFQALLLWFVVAICSILIVPHQYDITKTFHDKYLKGGERTWKKVSSPSNYWDWLETSWLPSLYNNTNQGSWYLVSEPIVRQIRAETENCSDQEHTTLLNISNCRKDNYIEDTSFAQSWSIVNNENANSPWSYLPDEKLNSTMHYGIINNYPESGYVWNLPSVNKENPLTEAVTSMKLLKQRNWLDKSTRAILHKCVVYFPVENQYASVSNIYEMTSSGFMLISLEMKYFNAYIINENIDYFFIACVTMLSLLTIYMTWKIISSIHNHGLKCLKDFWMLHMVFMIITFLVCVNLQIVNLFLSLNFQDELVEGHLKVGVNAHELALLQFVIKCFYGVLAFLAISRSVKIFSFSRVYKIVSLILNSTTIKHIIICLCVHILITIIFAMSAFLIYQQHLFEFRNFWQSFLSLLFYRWWKPGSKMMVDSVRWFGLLWNTLYMLYWILIVVNVFKAIIMTHGFKKRKMSLLQKSGFWTYVMNKIQNKKKKRRHVHFESQVAKDDVVLIDKRLLEDGAPTESTSSSLSSLLDADGTLRLPTVQKDIVLPPLPFETTNLETNLMAVMSGLDNLGREDQWEEEMFEQVQQKYFHLQNNNPYISSVA